jgi:hypothetical protein
MITFLAAIPLLQSAIQVSGGEGESIRLKLDIYADPQTVADIMQLRGKQLRVSIEVEEA